MNYVIVNILVIILECVGLWISVRARKWKVFVFYTQLANMVALLSSIAVVLTGMNRYAVMLRYLSSVMLLMTFLITLCVLVPMGGGFKKLMFDGNGIYHHTLCPIISIASYVFLEEHLTVLALPIAVTAVYGLVMLALNILKIYDGPYPFFRVYKQGVLKSILWFIALPVIITAVSMCIAFIAP